VTLTEEHELTVTSGDMEYPIVNDPVDLDINCELITPELAARFLKMIPGGLRHRPISRHQTTRYGSLMVSGLWDASIPIHFDTDGSLVNGRHRLQSIIDSGAAVYLNVVRGVSSASFEFLDVLKKRSFADYLAMHGLSNYCALSAVTTLFWKFRELGKPSASIHQRDTPTFGQLMGLLRDHPRLVDCTNYAANRLSVPNGLVRVSEIGFWSYVCSNYDPGLAVDFVESLRTGTMLHDLHPVYHLRNHLLRDLSSVKTSLGKDQRHGLISRAWEKSRAHEAVRRLDYHPPRHSFPSIPFDWTTPSTTDVLLGSDQRPTS